MSKVKQDIPAEQSPIPTITAFAQSPDRGRGLARDFRVRWAFEEVGRPYDVKLVTFAEMKQPDYRELQPFGQIPTYQDGELVLFESGAIVLHIARTHEGLLPKDLNARARATAWLFAALSTVEVPIIERSNAWLFEKEKIWYAERLKILDERVTTRLQELSKSLVGNAWLDGEFSVADLMMITVLRRLETSGLLDAYANIVDYVDRGKARPAYKRAFEAQLKVYTDSLSS